MAEEIESAGSRGDFIRFESTTPTFAASCVKDSAGGDVIIKFVNGANATRSCALSWPARNQK